MSSAAEEVPTARVLEQAGTAGAVAQTGTIVQAPPLVSIGMPVFNGEKFLAQAIGSILTQTLGDLELVICDNASSDATGEICATYAAHDRRVRYVRNPGNIGAGPNFDRCFQSGARHVFPLGGA